MMMFASTQVLAFLVLAFLVRNVVTAVLALIFLAVSAAFTSSMAEALCVELSAHASAKLTAESIMSLFVTSKAFGNLLTAYSSGQLIEYTSKQNVFLITSAFPVLIVVAALMMREVTTLPAQMQRQTAWQQLRHVWDFMRQPLLLPTIIYVVAYMGGPDYDDALFFFFTNRLGFSPTFLGSMRLTYGVAALIGVGIYQLVTKVPLKTVSRHTPRADLQHEKTPPCDKQILTWSILVSLPIYMLPILLVLGLNSRIGISNEAFLLSGGSLLEATAELQILPLIVYSCKVCPKGIEGTVFAILMSVRNAGALLSKAMSSFFTYQLGITATDFTSE
ncbi:unnamed protein product [Vitrella brassicaformis CCMP3155]|uniref:Uncharacterized protein n=1 Tax=Vitrella brassicaformis (strain CCMP3155) TaxID=1169540 RepID=A0A0G4GQT7_VITBC|nr:unnamed protein product [Vitrella brassicaformis CCMP3155]|eukprot:CEM32824.1 unnamed protein product [Vitrella brassicaformis CCMP3155]